MLDTLQDKADRIADEYGTPRFEVRLSSSLKATVGRARWGKRRYVVISQQLLVHSPGDAWDTLLHECAHMVAHDLGLDDGHGPHWRKLCIDIGGDGQRCFRGSESLMAAMRRA